MDIYSSIGEAQRNQSDKKNKINKFFKYEARITLFARDNFYKTVMVYMLCGMIACAFLYVAYLVYGAFSDVNAASMTPEAVAFLQYVILIIMTVTGLFFTFAALLGAYNFVCSFHNTPVRDEREPDSADFGELFAPIGNLISLRRCIKLFLIVFLQFLAVASPAVGGIYSLSVSAASSAVKVLGIALIVFAALNLFMFTAFLLLPYPYIKKRQPYLSVGQTYGLSARCAYKQLGRAYSLFGSFFWLIVISILSFGVLFIVYAVPYMSHAFSKLGAYMYDIYDSDKINKEKK